MNRKSIATGPFTAASRSRRAMAPALTMAAALIVAASQARAGDGPDEDAPPRRGAATAARGTAGIDGVFGIAATAVLAIVGLAALLAGRSRTPGAAGALRVVGRAHLTGRHAVYLLRAGDRTLIVGVGAQGPPALLGELEPTPEAARGSAGAGDRTGGGAR